MQDFTVASSSNGCTVLKADIKEIGNSSENRVETSPAAAAGQICELGTDGRLTVEWADGCRSQCFPHQLYLVSDEVCNVAFIT